MKFPVHKDALERHLATFEYTVNKTFTVLNVRSRAVESGLLTTSSDTLSASASEEPAPKRRRLVQSLLVPPVQMPPQVWVGGLREENYGFLSWSGHTFWSY